MQKKTRLRPRIIVLFLVILVVMSLILVDYLYHRQRIYPGVSIGGVAVGGMTVDEACLNLNELLKQEGFADKPLFFSLEDNNWTFTLADLGVDTSSQCCLDAFDTGRGKYHLFSYPARAGLIFNKIDIPLSFSVNDEKFLLRCLIYRKRYAFRHRMRNLPLQTTSKRLSSYLIHTGVNWM
jgi:hypothetical protein